MPYTIAQQTSSWLYAAVAGGCVILAAIIGSLATVPNIPTWYAGLAKPSFTPPNWIFGPAWTVLYILMTVSFWRILGLPPATTGRSLAITIFAIQLVLNALWSVAFFGFHSPVFGLVVIAALLVAILANIYVFWPLDHLAAFMMVPYLAWVAFASALNFSVFQLNR